MYNHQCLLHNTSNDHHCDEIHPQTTVSKRKCQRKFVTFHHDVLVYKESCQYSRKDRMVMHYTSDEMRSFTREILQYANIYSRGKDLCTLALVGIEAFVYPTVKDRKRRHKLKAVLTVMMEQERQFMELGHYSPIDVESMSKLYHNATKESQAEAHERAVQTSVILSDVLESQETNIAVSPKAELHRSIQKACRRQ